MKTKDIKVGDDYAYSPNYKSAKREYSSSKVKVVAVGLNARKLFEAGSMHGDRFVLDANTQYLWHGFLLEAGDYYGIPEGAKVTVEMLDRGKSAVVILHEHDPAWFERSLGLVPADAPYRPDYYFWVVNPGSIISPWEDYQAKRESLQAT